MIHAGGATVVRRSCSLTLVSVGLLASACGPSARPAAPTTTDTPAAEELRGRLQGTTSVDPATLSAYRWRYVEGTCTEGILDMSVRGFSETLVVEEVPGGLVFVADRHFGADECTQTVRLSATRSTDALAGALWSFQERSRVSYPDSPRCERITQEDALGEVRMRGANLELFIRRAPWCGGYEARLVYARTTTLGDDGAEGASGDEAAARTLRHFVAAWNDRDALAVAGLYAALGVHEDPHRPDEAGRPTRHQGRAAIAAYFADVFHQVPWLALRLLAAHVAPVAPGAGESDQRQQVHATVEYMDPRLASPLRGELALELVDGRVFSSRLELHAEGDADLEAPAGAP